jgi:hypothetical protein
MPLPEMTNGMPRNDDTARERFSDYPPLQRRLADWCARHRRFPYCPGGIEPIGCTQNKNQNVVGRCRPARE